MLVHLLTCLTLTVLTSYVFSMILFSPLASAQDNEPTHAEQCA